MLLALQTVVSAGYFPEKCCGSEQETMAAPASEHSHGAEHHSIETHDGAESCHHHRQSCPTSTATFFACLCQCGRDLQLVILGQQGYQIPQYHTVLSEAAGPPRLVPVMEPQLSMFSACRSHSPPGNSFRLNLRI